MPFHPDNPSCPNRPVEQTKSETGSVAEKKHEDVPASHLVPVESLIPGMKPPEEVHGIKFEDSSSTGNYFDTRFISKLFNREFGRRIRYRSIFDDARWANAIRSERKNNPHTANMSDEEVEKKNIGG